MSSDAGELPILGTGGFRLSTAAPIRAENLCHFYGKGTLRKQILFDLSFEIPAGEIVMVTGPSGSGKSTMLTLVGALRSTQEGSVQVLGRELRAASGATLEKTRRQIGFIFQKHHLLDALTAQQNVELGVRVGGRSSGAKARKYAAEMLDSVGLSDRRHHKPGQLSGGQQQRVAIARALASEPAILLADEPTAALDKVSGREVMDRIKSLAKDRGTTILLVTHDIRILDVADRLLHLEDGKLERFTDAAMADSRRLMRGVVGNRQEQPIEELISELDEEGISDMLNSLTEESRHFLDSVRLANDEAVHGMLGRAMNAFAERLKTLMRVERASLFMVDRKTETLWLRVAQGTEGIDEELRIPFGTGIAGAVAQTGEGARVDDVYQDPRFNPILDQRTGFRTRSVLCLPMRGENGDVFAVGQLINPLDGRAFDSGDEERFDRFLAGMSVVLETWWSMANWSAGR